MSKVITFSRTFPAYHPRKGEPTFFVEKFLRSIYGTGLPRIHELDSIDKKEKDFILSHEPKHHTIRAGNRFKAGDYFIPRVWGNDVNPKSGRTGAYHSKQITIAPPVLVVKTWEFELCINSDGVGVFKINDVEYICDYRKGVHAHYLLVDIAKNDGLSVDDLMDWFKYPKPFRGQIICWNKDVNY